MKAQLKGLSVPFTFLNKPVKGLAKAIYMYNYEHERSVKNEKEPSCTEPRGESRNAYRNTRDSVLPSDEQ